jgi:hypothetical protein
MIERPTRSDWLTLLALGILWGTSYVFIGETVPRRRVQGDLSVMAVVEIVLRIPPAVAR